MSRPVGYGLPDWLDTDLFLSADETRHLGPVVLGDQWSVCPVCRSRRVTDRAHLARKGMGGSKVGMGGPMVWLCRPCHTGKNGLDRQEDWCLAVDRYSGLLMWVHRSGFGHPLAGLPPVAEPFTDSPGPVG